MKAITVTAQMSCWRAGQPVDFVIEYQIATLLVRFLLRNWSHTRWSFTGFVELGLTSRMRIESSSCLEDPRAPKSYYQSVCFRGPNAAGPA
jgi:hypothetical protein